MLPQRFDTKWTPEPNTGCWLWIAGVNPLGYGQFWWSGRTVTAHRFAYEREVGPIPDGLELDHLCRTRCCVNPAHLEPVTHRENTLRGDTITGRQARQTHCKRGHPLSGPNLYAKPNGRRQCRTCAAASREKWRAHNAR